MKTRIPKKLAPCNAKNLTQVCALRTDNTDTKHSWILLGQGDTVTLCQQKTGEGKTGWVTIPRKEFTKLVRWYLRPQATVRR